MFTTLTTTEKTLKTLFDMFQKTNNFALKYLRYGETLDNDSPEMIYVLYGKEQLPFYEAKIYHLFNSKKFAVKIANQYFKEYIGLLELPRCAIEDIIENRLTSWLKNEYEVFLEQKSLSV